MDTGDGHRFSLLVKKPVHAILLIFKQVKHQYNLQHFSYHYHHYNQRCISKFWQVRNLRLPFQTVCSSVEKKGRKVCSSSNSYQRNSMKFKTKMELVAAQKPILFQRFCLKNALTRAKKHVKMAKNSVCDAKSPKVINAISSNSKLRWNP